jgi:AhpD family alkylhydroperoxidase
MTTASPQPTRSFPDLDEHTAPAPARAELTAVRAQFGGIPTPLARLASSPTALATAQHLLGVFEHTSLAPLEREVVAMTMGRVNGCHFCVGLHTQLLGRMPGGPALARALAAGERLGDPRLAALQRFVESVLERRGDVDEPTWTGWLAAGFSRADALDVVVGIATYTLTTFANRLTQV